MINPTHTAIAEKFLSEIPLCRIGSLGFRRYQSFSADLRGGRRGNVRRLSHSLLNRFGILACLTIRKPGVPEKQSQSQNHSDESMLLHHHAFLNQGSEHFADGTGPVGV